MRDFKNMKRQRSRNRSGGGGGKPQHNANRAFDSNGPDGVKVRGAAQHVFEKYQQLARDAQSSGDRVLAENYLQHAEHYFRVLRAVQPNRPVTEIMGRDAFASGYDIDFEDESLNNPPPEPEASAEGQQEGGEQQRDQQGGYDRNRGDYRQDGQRQESGRQDGGRQDGGRRDYNRDRDYRGDRDNRDRYEGRSDRSGDYRDNRDNRDRYDNRPRDDRAKEDRPKEDRPKEDRPREDRSRSERYSRDRYEPRGGERNGERADPLAVVEPQATPLTVEARPEAGSPVLRAQNGDVSHAPAFLQTRAETPGAEAEAPAEPKKRRGRPPQKAAEVAPAE
jgi:hypothetical protein